MPKEKEYGTRVRLLRVMRALIDRPYSYTKHQLAGQYSVHEDTISGDTVADRTVEPYHINPAEDTLQSFDVDKRIPRHFRISRIARVRLLDNHWQFEGSHNILRTDPFRIVDNNQINVHLRLSVGAYNELVERYPVTRSFILETEDPNYFDFQCMVNHRFFGLTNFILGFHHLEIQVLTPDSLRDHLLREISSIKF